MSDFEVPASSSSPPDLAAMRVRYTPGPLHEADVAGLAVRAVRPVAGRRHGRRSAGAERHGGLDGRRRRAAQQPTRPAQGARRGRLRLLHEPGLAQGDGSGCPPGRRALLRLVRDVAPGLRCRASRAGRPGHGRRLLVGAAARVPARGVGEPPVGSRPVARRPARAAGRGHGALPARRARPPARTSGAATGWSPTRSSSGRASPAGCTTGCATRVTTRGGRWTGSSRSHRGRESPGRGRSAGVLPIVGDDGARVDGSGPADRVTTWEFASRSAARHPWESSGRTGRLSGSHLTCPANTHYRTTSLLV